MSKAWRDYLENILVAIFLALFVRTFVLTAYKVPTVSMLPTLQAGDFIVSYRLPFGVKIPFTHWKWVLGQPQRADIVVFTFPDRPNVSYVKRVIGLPGDRIEFKEGKLWVNNQLVTSKLPLIANGDNQIFEETLNGKKYQIQVGGEIKSKAFGPIIVHPGEFFVLGDNRDASDDSRYWGTVPINKIESRVLLIWLSLDWNGNAWPQARWNRIITVPH